MTTETNRQASADGTFVECSNVNCERTTFLSMYEFADGTRAAYCTEHAGAAVMNGARKALTFATIDDTKQRKVAYAEDLLIEYGVLVANNAAMKTRLDEREKRGQSVDRSVLDAGREKEVELKQSIHDVLASI